MSEPRPSTLVAWPVAMIRELSRLPDTLHDIRAIVGEAAEAVRKIDATADFVRMSLEPLLQPLAGTVGRLESIDRAVGDLHGAVFAVLARVPGAKRSLRPSPRVGDAESGAVDLVEGPEPQTDPPARRRGNGQPRSPRA